MVRLGGPSQSCTSRNRARLLAFRNKQDATSPKALACSDAKEVKKYWSTLGTDEKLNLLRFEDQALANQLYEIQQSLYVADMECFARGFHGQEAVRHEAGVHFFDVEGVLDGKGSLSPKAFIAHRAFVEMEDMFEFLEKRMERPFLEGVPHIEPRHWSSLLKPLPTSWLGFVRVALSLVELALRKKWQESSTGPPSVLDPPAEVVCAEGAHSPDGVLSQSAKRKARKKRASFAHAVDICDAEPAAASDIFGVECLFASSQSHDETAQDGSTSSTSPEQTPSQSEGHLDVPSSVSAEPRSQRKSSRRARISSPRSSSTEAASSKTDEEGRWGRSWSAFNDDMPVLTMSQSLRCSAREARICAVVAPVMCAEQASRASAREAWVRAEIQMREERGRSRPPWLLVNGDSGENWVDGFRAVVKNSFIEVEEVEPESCALRARSWPICSWRHGGPYLVPRACGGA